MSVVVVVVVGDGADVFSISSSVVVVSESVVLFLLCIFRWCEIESFPFQWLYRCWCQF